MLTGRAYESLTGNARKNIDRKHAQKKLNGNAYNDIDQLHEKK